MIDYWCDVLQNLHFVCSMVCIFSFVFVVFANAHNAMEQKDNFIPKLIKTKGITILFIISFIGTICIPANLKYNKISEYIDKNAQLQKEINDMKYVIQKYDLEKQLEELNGN